MLASRLLAAATLLVVAAAPAFGQFEVTLSSDITVDLGGTVFADEDAVADDQLGTLTPGSLGALPGNVDVTGYEVLGNGDRIFTIDTTADLGGLTLTPADVGRFDGANYTLEFDGAAAGVPNGSRVDAVTVVTGGDLLLSFDTTVDLGGGVIAADEDLVQFDGASYTMFFDGSTAGIDEALDLDGASADVDTGRVFMSFDGSGSVGGVNFDDEDILRYHLNVWLLEYDGDAAHASLGPADVNAVPEPGAIATLVSGATLLGLLARRRRA